MLLRKTVVILIFPLACSAQEDYPKFVEVITRALYTNSQMSKDLDQGFRELKYQTPDYIVRPLEILLPTLNALREQKLELRYIRSF